MASRGIEANPIQCKSIMDSQIPTSRKGVQQLTGWLAALGRFISRFIDRLKPYLITLRGAKMANWNEECDQAFMAIKQYLTKPPILDSPAAGDTLYLYLVISEASVSATLFKENENKKQRPIFFVRKSLSEEETRYTHLEQAALALRVVAKQPHPYFQAHPIVVLTNFPLRSTIHKPDLLGRMVQWAIELREFGIQYKPCLALKGQILVDFLVEVPQQDADTDSIGYWILNVDGAFRQTGDGVGLQLKALTGEWI